MSRIGWACAGISALLTMVGVAGASPEDWRRGEYKYFKEPHKFGPLCEYRIAAHGGAPLTFFGDAKEVHKAEERAIRDWEFEAARLFTPRYGAWTRAMGKELRCNVKGLEFECIAAANPCRER
jgi:hypothetical protein